MNIPIQRRPDSDPAMEFAPPWARAQVSSSPRPRTVDRAPPELPISRIIDRQIDREDVELRDRQVLEALRQRSLKPSHVPVPSKSGASSIWPMLLRMCVLLGLAAVIGWICFAVFGGRHQNSQSADRSSSTSLINTSVSLPKQESQPAILPSENNAAVMGQSAIATATAVGEGSHPLVSSPVPLAANAPDQSTSVTGHPATAASKTVQAVASPQLTPDAAAVVAAKSGARTIDAMTSPSTVASASGTPRVGDAPARPQSAIASGSLPVSAPDGPVSSHVDSMHMDAAKVAMLLSRGKDFLASGDFAGARLVLQRAAEAGSAEAALTLGSTFDPFVIQRLEAVSVKPDADRARKWYQKAIELGSTAARQQLANLAGAR